LRLLLLPLKIAVDETFKLLSAEMIREDPMLIFYSYISLISEKILFGGVFTARERHGWLVDRGMCKVPSYCESIIEVGPYLLNYLSTHRTGISGPQVIDTHHIDHVCIVQ
jgi:hypothetical protein